MFTPDRLPVVARCCKVDAGRHGGRHRSAEDAALRQPLSFSGFIDGVYDTFSGNAPTYHIALFDDAPALVWDFHSLMLAIALVFSFMLTDTDNPLHMCKNCGKVFIAEKQNSLFCSAECKTQYRAQKKQKKQEKK